MELNIEKKQKTFINDDFLLSNDFARKLYHNHVKHLPVIDYHCHLPPDQIAGNQQFENLTQIWLNGDHYKWRAMRTLGISENFITGNAPDREKFAQWAYTVPYTMRNPLYHWTHLELLRYFGIGSLLNPQTAGKIYDETATLLQSNDFAVQQLIKKMNVEVICTTDDPADSLEHHIRIHNNPFGTKILPSFRPDKAYSVENPEKFNQYLNLLGQRANLEIKSFTGLLEALHNRIEYFHQHGCRLSDHGLEYMPWQDAGSLSNPEKIFLKIHDNHPLSPTEIVSFKYAVLIELCRMYHAKGWTQQFHLGALRNTNSRMMATLGPDTGFDSIGDFQQGVSLARFLNELDRTNQLAKTILYNLNPADNEVMATMTGNFNDGTVRGKIQFGSAWWFLDQKDGMEKQLNALSNLGLLSCFIGMLTDSRSFMSFPRHEYFRRILCNLIGKDVENGELPADENWLGNIAAGISYHNAKNYFGF